MPLSPGSQRWAYNGHSGLFRPVQFVIVVHPIEWVVASAMIGGHHKAGISARFGIGLVLLPQGAQVTIGSVKTLQHAVVAHVVCPVIGFSQGKIQDAG